MHTATATWRVSGAAGETGLGLTELENYTTKHDVSALKARTEKVHD